ncbi:hypothetical protein E1B28_002408 [Marasmius oreades]|uniref:Uncharacterized protein n=1 Tax=Marasmius oreades TaxID=181124 RepID=A0A9P7RMK6_9AGAR|nr:uncharacterized protein E1B28_002408 [Marasmius oreades]KAG7086456.1 hypothetical protein E1B28_002408 [Marasmius oreades]
MCATTPKKDRKLFLDAYVVFPMKSPRIPRIHVMSLSQERGRTMTEKNGRFVIHDTDENRRTWAALEKSTDAQNHYKNVQVPRLESLLDVSEQCNSNPAVKKANDQWNKARQEKLSLESQRRKLPPTATSITAVMHSDTCVLVALVRCRQL